MNSPLRIAALLLSVGAVAATSSACGSDDDTPSPADSSSSSSSSAGGDRASATLDAFGTAASGVVGSIEGYEVDGSRIVFDSRSIDQAAGASHCIILTTAANGVSVPPDTEIVVEYSDGSTTCELDQ